MANNEYENSIRKWRQEMDTNLRRENGWLTLAGLFWLRNGTNIIGSDPESDILLPGRAPARLGTFMFDGNNVTLTVEASLPVEVNGVARTSALLDADQEDVPSFITFDGMRMVVVRRSKGVGIRVWDNERVERRSFPTRQWYPVKKEFRVPSTYTRYETPKIVNGHVFVDFNKAYGPPCAFTRFATCTFPPQENHLDVAIEAGELFPEQHD